MNRFFAFIILISCLQSCKPGKLDPQMQDLGFEYYPLETGLYYIYDVDVTEFMSSGPEERSFQVKEVIRDTLQLTGETVFRLERFYRSSSSSEWPLQPDSVWTVRKDYSQVVRSENNIRYLKLIFPVEEGKEWDGNSHNILSKEEYKIRALEQPFTIEHQHYPQTLKILHRGDSSLLGKDYREEVFAKGIGLIYKVTENIEYRNSGGVIGSDTTGGILYYQKIREYGKE